MVAAEETPGKRRSAIDHGRGVTIHAVPRAIPAHVMVLRSAWSRRRGNGSSRGSFFENRLKLLPRMRPCIVQVRH